jgi:hypothetical protein
MNSKLIPIVFASVIGTSSHAIAQQNTADPTAPVAARQEVPDWVRRQYDDLSRRGRFGSADADRHVMELYFTPPGGKEILADRSVMSPR